MRTSAIVTQVAACGLLSACATTPATNPPECAPVVAEHRADPTLPVDVAPRTRGGGLQRIRVERPLREYEVSFVVDETGRVVANTIVVTPPPPDPPSVRDGFARRQYFPARVDGCMVPSRTTATVILEG